jgi:hypothetical protein
MTNKFLSTVAVTALLSTNAFAELSRNKALDKMMYTINPGATLSGPVYSDQSDSATKSKYASDLVRLILKEAHAQAASYLEANDTQAYYAALVMALTVPMHEGLYIQYRSVQGDACNADANSGELVKKAGETNYSLFNQYFKTPENPFFPNCEDLGTDQLTQIIRGGDGTDLSIMQVSIRWHFDDFLANKKYESVESTLQYGIGHLMKGFNPVYRNVADYKCISESGFFKKKKINYINLIRGVWAGQYNSGSISKTCRFADSSSPFKGHDRGFEANLNKVLAFNGTLSVDMVGDFKLEPEVSAAFKEVVSNLKDNKNDRTALENILK